MAYDETKVAALSEDIRAKLLSRDSEMIKTAGLAADDYFRTKIRENGILRRMLPPVTITKDRLDYSEDTDLPLFYVEIAPDSAGAKLVSFETGPHNEVVHGKKARVEFNRIMTPKYGMDRIRLEAGYRMPLLDIYYDEMLKDIMDVEDSIHVAAIKSIVGNTMNANNAALGCKRWTSAGPVSREAVVHLKKAMYLTKGNLQPNKFLMNWGTYCDFGILDRDELGGDMAETIFINGVTLTKIQGIDTVVTIKHDLIDDNDVWIYTAPKYFGGFYTYEDVTMVNDEQDNIFLTFFAHETVAHTIVNVAGIARATMSGSLVGWNNA